jgi:hypothetical protein
VGTGTRFVFDNTITGYTQSAAFTGHGSATSLFRNNLIERGGDGSQK